MAAEEEKATEAGQRNRIYATLKSIDERLEVVVKLLGYISILIVTPLVFVLSYIGYDINAALGIRETSESQKAAAAELSAEGWSVDSAGALKALAESNENFDKFLLIGEIPENEAALEAIRVVIVSGKKPASTSEAFTSYINSDQKRVGEVLAHIGTFNGVVERLKAGGYTSEAEFCSSFTGFVQGGDFAMNLSANKNCEAAAQSGEYVGILLAIHGALKQWSQVIDGASVVEVSQADQVSFSSRFAKNEAAAEIQPFSSEAFFSSTAGTVHRFRTAMKVLSPPAYWESKGAWSIALLEQEVPNRRGGYLPVVIVDAYGEWDVGIQDCFAILYGLGTSCDVDFSAVLVDGEMHVTAVTKVYAVSDGQSDIPFLTGIDFALEQLQ
ncbi:MAG: hypothetical protein IOD05_04535 [Rhodobacter sp.]|nr:hypothetical protein [Rhodobacter sp.]MCA3502522.1 hypothetical protein [Rhodobacter sp.]